VTDANYLFDIARYTMHGGLSRVATLFPPSLVVGVGYPADEGDASYYARRNYDFHGPWDMTDKIGQLIQSVFEDWKNAEGNAALQMRAGGYERFLAFLREGLLPGLASCYPVDRAARHTIIGCSSGGHFVQRALFDPKSPFKRYVCISPSFAAASGEIEKAEAEYAAAHSDLDADVYICSGRASLNHEVYAISREASGVVWTAEQFAIRKWPSARIDWEIMDFEDHATNMQRAVSAGLRSVHRIRPGRDDEEVRKRLAAIEPAAFRADAKPRA
jgi:hypothetical protein